MRHLIIFENYNNSTEKQQEAIEALTKTWYSGNVIDEKGVRVGGTVGENHSLENLVNNYVQYVRDNEENESNSAHVIVENKRRILSEEEIEQIYQSSKYNL